MTKRFTLVNIGQMHFYAGNPYTSDRIPNGHTGMRIGRCIDDDKVGAIKPGLLDPINQRTLVIALVRDGCHAQAVAQRHQVRIKIAQRAIAINMGFARAEQIQIRAMQDKYALSHEGKLPQVRR